MKQAALIQGILEDKKAQNICILDVKEKTSIAQYFIIATANNQRHLKALARYIEEECKKAGYPLVGSCGLSEASHWVVLDYADIVVHLLTDESRAMYQLESLWK